MGQDVTVINRFNGSDNDTVPENYVLKNVYEHTYIINEYEPINTGPRGNLDAMIRYGLRSYTDKQFHIFDNRVQALIPVSDFEKAASGIVRDAIWIHDMPFADAFPGFSQRVLNQIGELRRIDGYTVSGGAHYMDAPGENKVGRYTFQRMVYDLKRSMELEVAVFLNTQMPGTEEPVFGEEEKPLLSEKNFNLRPLQGSNRELAALEPSLDDWFSENEKETPDRKKKKKPESELAPFAAKVVELLEQNSKILAQYNQRFENLQSQIDDLRNQAPADNSEVKQEIAELRDMIRDLAAGQRIREPNGSVTEQVSGKSVEVIFEKNAHTLSFAQKALLNKVDITLRQNPSYAALITGYADKTGNPGFNAWISKKRAEAVKAYLISRGIDGSRLIVNFLGDSESDAANPLDRKVKVTYLSNR